MATSEIPEPGAVATAPFFSCVFSHHDHARQEPSAHDTLGTCDCCADMFAGWDIPAPPAVATACFGPLGMLGICEHCLAEYLPQGHQHHRSSDQ